MRKPKADSTALTVMGDGTEVGMLADLDAKAFAYEMRAVSFNTLKRYGECWLKFEGWCKAHRLSAMPAEVSTVRSYWTWLASEQDYAASSVTQARAAIKFTHEKKGPRRAF